MSANRLYLLLAVVALLRPGTVSAQQAAPSRATALESRPTSDEPEAVRAMAQDPGGIGRGSNVPRLIKWSGALKTVVGTPLTGTHGLTLALYKEQQGGAPIWLESQNVELDEQGRYTVLLGSTRTEGVPVDLFRGDEARWLGVQVQLPGYREEARVLLVSVPYALKAAEAETLGGLPVSAFVLTPEAAQRAAARGLASGAAGFQTAATGRKAAEVSGTGTINQLTKWLDTNGTLGNSLVTDNGSTVSVGTELAVNQGASQFLLLDSSNPNGGSILALYNNTAARQLSLRLYPSGTLNIRDDTAGVERMTFDTAGNVGIGTTAPRATLDITGSTIAQGIIETLGVNEVDVGAPIATTGGNIYGGGPTYRGNVSAWQPTANGQQMIVDLGALIYQVNGISFGTYYYVDPRYIPAAYSLDYSTDEATWTNLATVTGNSRTDVYQGGFTVNARYIRLTVNAFQSGQTFATITGFRVFAYSGGAMAGSPVWSVLPGLSQNNVTLATVGNVGIGTTTPAQKLEVDGNLLIGPANSGSGIIFPDGTTQTSACGALGFSTSPESVTQRVKPHEIHLVNNGQSCSYVIEPTTFHTLMEMISQHDQSLKDVQTDNATMKQTIQDLQAQIAELRRLIGAKDK
jgi:hypothetical protein